MSEINVENCIHCGLCTRNCSFLKKYDLDLQKFSEHPELAYSCFMCRKCSQVCPKKISGEKIALAMRKEQVQNGEGAKKDLAYRGLLWEKNRYKFANYKKSKKKSVFMPGCNFSSFFPKTTKRLEKIMKKYDIDKYIAKNRELYGKKCAAMVSAMEKYFPQGKVKWVVPEGGIFLWCECPTIEDITPIVDKCLEKKVAIVPGSNFATDIYAPSNMFRLNYSSATIENIEEGVRRLGEVLTEML